MSDERAYIVLEKYWGYTEFRSPQADVIANVLAGNDTFALMPTGGGKSLCYQIPALLFKGLTIVVSPLIALMKDQVYNLEQKGIHAAALYSGLSQKESDFILTQVSDGKIKLLYVSPERLNSERFKRALRLFDVSLIAVDEAHCISQWGYDFRPEYLQIAEVREICHAPILALTATATPEVVLDIQDKLSFKKGKVFRKSFFRENLQYLVLYDDIKTHKIIHLAKSIKGSGVIYTNSRKETERLAEILSKENISSAAYHAGLSNDERDRRQSGWMQNSIRIVVCTNAFGMGIDKPDVRFVIHYQLPQSLEAYYQEAGRGGRDGKVSYAILLYQPEDAINAQNRLEKVKPDKKFIQRVYDSIGNHFGLPIGAGKHQVYEFDFTEFCKKYSLEPINAYFSMQVLHRLGYLLMSEQPKSISRLRFLCQGRELYAFQMENNPGLTPLIENLLRMYGGLFEHYVNISEYQIAKRLNTTKVKVITALQWLAKKEVVDYAQATDASTITFLEERLSIDNLSIDINYLQKLHQQQQDKLSKSIAYAGDFQICRSIKLLNYFGEYDTRECGNCDVCRAMNETEPTVALINKVWVRIQDSELKIFQINELIALSKIRNKELAAECISRLVLMNKLIFLEDNYALV